MPHWGAALYVRDRVGGEALRYYLAGPDDVDGVPTLTVCDGYALEMDERHGGGPMTEQIPVAAVLRWGSPEQRYRRD